jgi:hypothetical protein
MSVQRDTEILRAEFAKWFSSTGESWWRSRTNNDENGFFRREAGLILIIVDAAEGFGSMQWNKLMKRRNFGR